MPTVEEALHEPAAGRTLDSVIWLRMTTHLGPMRGSQSVRKPFGAA
jgi:hypothetical protein